MKKIMNMLSIPVIITSFIVIRYPLFYLHGMKQFPIFLCLISLVIAFIFRKRDNSLLPMFSALGFVIGFIAGVLFQSSSLDPGGGTMNNLWIIWMAVFLCTILLGMVLSRVKRSNK